LAIFFEVILSPMASIAPAGRADEGDTGGLQRLGEFLVLRQEPVARMHRLGARGPDRVHDLVDHDIRLGGGRRADMHRLVGHPHMQRMTVGIRIDRDRRDPHLARGLDDAAGDLAPVGDQDLLEHYGCPFVLAGHAAAPSAGRETKRTTGAHWPRWSRFME
jgi:hypothetical protein